jgi:Zn-dependent protease with chaperone function
MRFRQHQDEARRQTRRLLGLFALVVIVLVLAVNGVLALLWWLLVPWAASLPPYFVATNTGLVLLYVLGGWAVESSRLADGGALRIARLAGAREAQAGRGNSLARLEGRFVNVVQEMAIASGVRPPPAAWVLARDDAINAFAVGWGPDDALVAVSRGALERLTREELQGVVAHEFSHLVHEDGALNLRLVGMVWGLQLIWNLGLALAEPDERGRRGAGFPVGLVLLAVGFLGWLAGRALQAAVSRQREFLADASAVKYTRQVDGLGGALRKLADQQAAGEYRLASAQAGTIQHLLFAPSIRPPRWRSLLATHPPLAERIARLYGHAVDSLPARVQPSLDEAEPPHPVLVPLHQADAVIGADIPADAEALRHDALQRPASFDASAREQEALARIALWHGPGEWQAAMLALGIEPMASGRPGAAGLWRAWQVATADLNVATAVSAEIAALGPIARRRVFEQLLQRAATAPRAARRAMWRAWLMRWHAIHGVHGRLPPREAWRAFAIRHGLAPRAARPPRETLATGSNAVLAATREMARCLGVPLAPQQAWTAAALAALHALGLPAARGPALGLAPPAASPHERLAALRVRHLSPMQRPLLLRAWIEAAERTGVLDASADALHLAAVVLDLPAPPALGAQPSSDWRSITRETRP